MKGIKNKKDGFSLIEILISVSLLATIIGGIVLFGVRSIEAHTKSQAMQAAVENARFAIEGMNKKIRTSHDLNKNDTSNATAGMTQIYFVDNVDENRYCYYFASNALSVAFVDRSAASSIDTCAEVRSSGTVRELVGGSVSVTGRFYVLETSNTAPYQRGMVTATIKLDQNSSAANPTEKDSVTIQSSVSLRDYYY